jgi:hypothetical protein
VLSAEALGSLLLMMREKSTKKEERPCEQCEARLPPANG